MWPGITALALDSLWRPCHPVRAGGLWGPRKRQRAWQSFNAYICGMKRDILA